MKEMKFSIIVRIYNAEKYLYQSIESVINQTYKNWELILVDDGSTDNSLEICTNYEQVDKRIKVFHQENQGGVAAQLTGFKKVTGDYIFGLDADDWYEPELLEKCFNYINENENIDLIMFGYNCVYEEENKTSIFSLTEADQILQTEDLVKFVMQSTAHALWLKVYSKKVLNYNDFEKDIIAKNSHNFKSNNDLFLGTPLLFNVNKAFISKEILYNYRIISNSISHKIIPYKRIVTSLNTMNYFYQLFSERNFLKDNFEYLIINEIYREILPEIYKVFRYFKIDLKEIHKIKKNQYFKTLLSFPKRREILKSHCYKHKISFFIFTKIL